MRIQRRTALSWGVAAAAGAAGAGLAWWRLRPGPVRSEAESAFWASRFDSPAGAPLALQAWQGRPLLVNFWATWCPPCRAEHPVLLQMAADGLRVAGVNIRDDDAKAVAYLEEEGNPFLGVATDPAMRGAIEWGVTAPPETFIVAGDGTVLFRFQGPLVGTDYEDRFLPELQKALAGQE